MEPKEKDSTLIELESAFSNLKTILQASANMEANLEKMDTKFDLMQETLTTASKRVAPLQSSAMATKALESRINRAVSPAVALLKSFKRAESLQHKLLRLSNSATITDPKKRLGYLLKYVDCVDQLNAAITSISKDCEPTIQKLQEVVEFVSRTKATDQFRTLRLKETLVTLKALYEAEVDGMRYEGLLDQALLSLQDEYEKILQQLKHKNIGDSQLYVEAETIASDDLGSDLEVEVLRRISETLASNDCLDICIDIFVRVRYRRAAKALMRLSPDYLRTYAPEDINEMEWATLETAITLWIQHFELAVKRVLVSEKKHCNKVLARIMDGFIWAECFVKIADKIMAVFFRFGEGVARSSKEPQKLFKLLDMFDSLEKLKTEFSEVFEGEAGADICSRFRELEKLLVHASSKVLWEFGLQIEGNQGGPPPPQDGSVPKLVRYAVNYLKCLTSDHYSVAMSKVLRTEQIWKAGILSKPETDENLLKDAILNIMEALKRNVESQRSRYRDKILPHIFSMNTFWYIYMRTRNTELGKLLSEQWLKTNYKTVAEESAYMYQKQAWGPLVWLLDQEEPRRPNKELTRGASMRGKIETFMRGFDDMSERHRSSYTIPDADLREQLSEATVKLLVPAYAEFLSSNSSFLQANSFPTPDSIQSLIDQVFDSDGKSTIRRSYSKEMSVERTYDINDFQGLNRR